MCRGHRSGESEVGYTGCWAMVQDAEAASNDDACSALVDSLEDVPLDDVSEVGSAAPSVTAIAPKAGWSFFRRTASKGVSDTAVPVAQAPTLVEERIIDARSGPLAAMCSGEGPKHPSEQSADTCELAAEDSKLAEETCCCTTAEKEEEVEEQWYEFKVMDPDDGEVVTWVRRSQCAWTTPAPQTGSVAAESGSSRDASEEPAKSPNPLEALTKTWRGVFKKMVPGSGVGGAAEDPLIFGAGFMPAGRTELADPVASPESCVVVSPPAVQQHTWSLKQKMSSGLMQVRTVVSAVSTKDSGESTSDDDVFSIGTGSEDFSDFEEECCISDGQDA